MASQDDDRSVAQRLRDAVPLGGGTDLLPFIDEDLARPSALVDLRRVQGMRDISETEEGEGFASVPVCESTTSPAIGESSRNTPRSRRRAHRSERQPSGRWVPSAAICASVQVLVLSPRHPVSQERRDGLPGRER